MSSHGTLIPLLLHKLKIIINYGLRHSYIRIMVIPIKFDKIFFPSQTCHKFHRKLPALFNRIRTNIQSLQFSTECASCRLIGQTEPTLTNNWISHWIKRMNHSNDFDDLFHYYYCLFSSASYRYRIESIFNNNKSYSESKKRILLNNHSAQYPLRL